MLVEYGRVAQTECPRQVDDLHAGIDQPRRQVERHLSGGGEQHRGAFARQLEGLVLRRVLELPRASRKPGAPRGRLTLPSVAGEELQLHPRMRGEDAARLETRITGGAHDADGNVLHDAAYL